MTCIYTFHRNYGNRVVKYRQMIKAILYYLFRDWRKLPMRRTDENDIKPIEIEELPVFDKDIEWKWNSNFTSPYDTL